MRNLKKILALALALIMSLSLMATASATTFADDGSINDTYRQAVEVLNGLEVLKGDDNGFRPGDTITRAEVAAIIYRITTGDVTDARVDNFTPYGQFSDVNAGSWYAGYVTYSANAGYIKGVGNGKFNPNNNVTGYEVLTMILRTVGYDKADNEFTGPDWQLHVASTAQQLGILNNCADVRLGDDARRQEVAEMIFRAILLNKVDYSTVTRNYTPNDEHVADVLGLEELTGVVTANEYADLNDVEPLAEGKTRLDVDGKAYTLDITTELNDIGELRHAYVKDGIVYGGLEDGGSAVAEAANNGGEGTTVANLAKSAGLTLNAETTEYMVNFGEDWEHDSEYRLEYTVTFDVTAANQGSNYGRNLFASEYIDVYAVKRANGWTDFTGGMADVAINSETDPDNLDKDLLFSGAGTNTHTFNKVILAGHKITSTDLKIMEGIFKSADGSSNGTTTRGITGSVYSGSNSTNNTNTTNQDLSDTMSWNQFYDTYINSGELSYRESDNGEWLKIIDNDGDGVADYVLRTDFVMTTITRHNANNDTYTVEYRVGGTNVEIPAADITAKDHLNVGDVAVMQTTAADELSIGDVVLYTLIDGVYHISIVEPEVAVVEGININNETFTVDSETVEWSGIDYEAASYYDSVVDGVAKTEYKLYKDLFGYIRLYIEVDKGFVVLTDAYYDTDERLNASLREQVWKVEAWDLDAGESVDWTLANNDAEFVEEISGGGVNDTKDNRGTWTRLIEFGQFRYDPWTNYGRYSAGGENMTDDRGTASTSDDVTITTVADSFKTNVAAYTVQDGKYTLVDPNNLPANTTTYHSYEVLNPELGALNMDGVDSWTAANTSTDIIRVRANSNTQYYYVTVNSQGVASVAETWFGRTGYSKSASSYTVDRAYVVASEVPEFAAYRSTNSNSYYEVAQVVVIECTLTSSVASSGTANLALNASADTNYPNATYIRERKADNSNGYDPRYVVALGYDSDAEGYVTDKALELASSQYDGLLAFYDDAGYFISGKTQKANEHTVYSYSHYGISAGRIVSWNSLHEDYDLSSGRANITSSSAVVEESVSYDDVPIYVVRPYTGGSRNGGYELAICSSSSQSDEVIYLYTPEGDVGAVINVAQSKQWLTDKAYTELMTLWGDICDEIGNGTSSITFFGKSEEDAEHDTIRVTYKEAYDWVNENGEDVDVLTVTGSYELIKNGSNTTTTASKVEFSETSVTYYLTVNKGAANEKTYTLIQEAPALGFGELVAKDQNTVVDIKDQRAAGVNKAGFAVLSVQDAESLLVSNLINYLTLEGNTSRITAVTGYDAAGSVWREATVAKASEIIVSVVNDEGKTREIELQIVTEDMIGGIYMLNLPEDGSVKAYVWSTPASNNPGDQTLITKPYVTAADMYINNGARKIMLVADKPGTINVSGGGVGITWDNGNYGSSDTVLSGIYQGNAIKVSSTSISASITVTFTPDPNVQPIDGEIAKLELWHKKQHNELGFAWQEGTADEGEITIKMTDASVLPQKSDKAEDVIQTWLGVDSGGTSAEDPASTSEVTGWLSYEVVSAKADSISYEITAHGRYGGEDSDPVTVNFVVDTTTPVYIACFTGVAQRNNIQIALWNVQTKSFLTEDELKALNVTEATITINGTATKIKATDMVKYTADENAESNTAIRITNLSPQADPSDPTTTSKQSKANFQLFSGDFSTSGTLIPNSAACTYAYQGWKTKASGSTTVDIDLGSNVLIVDYNGVIS